MCTATSPPTGCSGFTTLVQEQLALYRGHVVKTQGDSFMVSFDSARTAVTCAIAIQKAIGEANRQQGGAGIGIGIGINTGEPVREGADFFGGTVNLAARICAVAEPGQVLVSETVRAVTGKMEGSSFNDLGDFELKGFREGRSMAIGVVADGPHISLYLNAVRVAQVVEARANGGTTPGFFMDGRSGSLHLQSVRYYAVS
jgi:Adenylate and Guanylate cyclase catalytic domain